jgi:DNA-binding response OmpR family regulator
MSAGKTILIVDDDKDLAQGLQTVLEGQGYRVVTAHDGEAGLQSAQREKPDLVLVDMMMPKKSGFLVLEGLKTAVTAPKVIMMTANEGSRHRAYAEMLGVDDYLRKPFGMDKLFDSINRLCPQNQPQMNTDQHR